MKIRSFILSLICVFAFSINASAQSITVAVAANLQYTFDELKSEFEKETGIIINTVIGSSGKITAQIKNGAPFDIFMSADMDYPSSLEKDNLTYNKPQIYANGALVIWSMADIDMSNGIEILSESYISKIAVANPKTAPYGLQAINCLKYYNIFYKVENKLVYGENISQTNQFITTKAADAGITAKSVVMAPNIKDQGSWIEIDKEAYEPIAQGVVILEYAKHGRLEQSKKFFDFLFSEKAKEIFIKYGYIVK